MYDNHEDCNWKITAPTGSNVRLQFTNFETESCCDKLKIYDGVDDGGSLLGELSGSGYNGEMVTTGSNMYVHFTSDSSITMSGFRGVLTYTTGRVRIPCVVMNDLIITPASRTKEPYNPPNIIDFKHEFR